ncbi:BQ5605_C143g13440 [Microbotryum silenes-dioicae]|uniref:BQ5605_C143g13440 protein n=1 Tax=Microbotryum silenes-dioicae TaxID=796604 RepID=A0A2X0MUV0_9BASI|nr:BQ5605_C143g13440 [Microbotryum silenes-dioicae]
MFGTSEAQGQSAQSRRSGRTIEIFTGLVLEMISSGRWGMQKWGTRTGGCWEEEDHLGGEVEAEGGRSLGEERAVEAGFDFPPHHHTHTHQILVTSFSPTVH